jgi:hypothetical protein
MGWGVLTIVLPRQRGREGVMTPDGVRQYVEAIRGRYQLAGKVGKGQLLTEFCLTTGLHRKTGVRLLRGGGGKGGRRRGRPKVYGEDVAEALRKVWELSDWLCSKRLQPYLVELVAVLERHGELVLAPEVKRKLVGMSPATIDRMLKLHRDRNLRRPYLGSRRQVSSLRGQVPIRTGVEYGSVGAGYLEIDLVAHCGESTEGSYVHTLDAVDFATGWCELVPIWGKTQDHVGSAIAALQRRLAFGLRGLDCDNGSEFINQVLYAFCHRHNIEFTRSRPYRKNDQAHIEERNWFVVRRTIGYDRYATKSAFTQLEATLRVLQEYMNHFQPIRKVKSKERIGPKVHKRYDEAQTPYQRLLASGVLSPEKTEALQRHYQHLNPVTLRAELNQALDQLWELRERPTPNDRSAAHQRAKLTASRQDVGTDILSGQSANAKTTTTTVT